MNDTIWMSGALREAPLPFAVEDRVVPALERAQNSLRHSNGAHLDPGLLPQRAINQPYQVVSKLPHVFLISDFLCVSEKVAAVLRDHDLGQGGLYPIELMQVDGVTPFPGPFWALNFGAEKRVLNDAESRQLRKVPSGQYTPKLTVKADEIALFHEAMKGADLWTDPQLVRVFFLSPRLKAALTRARLDTAFRLLSCRLIYRH